MFINICMHLHNIHTYILGVAVVRSLLSDSMLLFQSRYMASWVMIFHECIKPTKTLSLVHRERVQNIFTRCSSMTSEQLIKQVKNNIYTMRCAWTLTKWVEHPTINLWERAQKDFVYFYSCAEAAGLVNYLNSSGAGRRYSSR